MRLKYLVTLALFFSTITSFAEETPVFVKSMIQTKDLNSVNSVPDPKAKDLSKLEFFLAELISKSGFDDKESIKIIFEKGLENQDPKIISYLAGSLEKGFIYDKDIERSILMYNKAIELGDDNSMMALAQLYLTEKNDTIIAGNLFNSFYSKNNNKKTAYIIGSMLYKNGNINDSLYWLKISSNLGSDKASFLLGKIYLETDRLYNKKEAVKYLTLSAENGNTDALQILNSISYTKVQKCIIENLISLNIDGEIVDVACRNKSLAIYEHTYKLSRIFTTKD